MTGSIPIVENSPSFSGNIRSRLRERTLLFRYLVTINLIFGAWYLHWRFSALNSEALLLSILLLLAEIYSYVGGVIFLICLWRPIIRQIKSFNQMTPPFPLADYPNVDVFITCYNEPVEIVEATTKAALAINYPVNKLRVYILDDGNNPQMRTMAEKLCIEDLQTPAIQQASEQINTRRSQLNYQLQRLQNLAPEIIEAEKLLQFQHQFKSDRNIFPEVLAWFDSLKTDSIPAMVWFECQTILAEGFDNAVRHAHRGLPSETPIDIEVAIYHQSIEIQIKDRGNNFDLEAYLLQISTEVNNEAEGGRGLLIIQQLADSFSYINYEHGNCLFISKSYETELDIEKYQPIYYLQGFRQLILINSKHQQVRDYISEEIKKLEQEIYQQEIDLSDLARCRYIARPKPEGKPHHAKAGNINYALFSGETSGDFVLTLDADHIPKPEFLQRVLPYFYQYNLYTGKYETNQIAFVQTPQAFYNLPPDDPFCHRANLFYGPIQQGKDGMNAAFYTGTNAILRREALINVGLQNFSDEYIKDAGKLEEFDLVGGVSSTSITEDMNTAMHLHAAGWKSVYHHEILSSGLAPDDLSSTLKQRLRWAQGTIQVLRKDNPWTKPGLSFWQRLQYFQTMYSYFSGFFTLIFIACPIIYFFTGLIPVRAFGTEFAIHFVPAFVLNRLTFIAASWGIAAGELWRCEQYAIALFPLMIQAVVSVFTGKNLKFQVTPKQRQSGIYLGLIIPQLSVFCLTFLGIFWCIYLLVTGKLNHPTTYIVNAAWAIYNLSLLWSIVRAAVWQPKNN